jgi:CubicO group peptidase (beta-lactamase class C family)
MHGTLFFAPNQIGFVERSNAMSSCFRVAIVRALVAVALCQGAGKAQESTFDSLVAEIENARERWQVPGVAVTAIKDGEIAFLRGFGVRKTGETANAAKVDERTLFAIASNTKSMTATLLAMLVDQREIRWDDRVVGLLPEVQMFDPYVSRELTIRDLLCHRNGLPDFGGDIVWWGSTYDRSDVLRRIRHVRPVTSFRSRWAYQNTMFIVAGEIAAKICRKPWDQLMEERLFEPIGMEDSLTSVRRLGGKTNVASPHMRIGDRVEPIAWRNLDNGGPAASVISNAKDLAAWLRFLVNGATVNGKEFVSQKSLQDTWAAQMVLPVSDHDLKFFGSNFRAYGLGWMIRDYHGMKVLYHGGWADGMLSFTAFVPERKAGVAVLTNLHNRDLSIPVAHCLLDHCLGRPSRDWCGEFLATTLQNERQRQIDVDRLQADRHRDTRPSLPLAEFAGKYANDLYGPLEVALHDGQLELKLLASPTYSARLTHWHFDTFQAIWADPVAETSQITFSMNAEGRATNVRFRMADFIDPTTYVYERISR